MDFNRQKLNFEVLCTLSTKPMPIKKLMEDFGLELSDFRKVMDMLSAWGIVIQERILGNEAVCFVDKRTWQRAQTMCESYWRSTYEKPEKTEKPAERVAKVPIANPVKLKKQKAVLA